MPAQHALPRSAPTAELPRPRQGHPKPPRGTQAFVISLGRQGVRHGDGVEGRGTFAGLPRTYQGFAEQARHSRVN